MSLSSSLLSCRVGLRGVLEEGLRWDRVRHGVIGVVLRGAVGSSRGKWVGVRQGTGTGTSVVDGVVVPVAVVWWHRHRRGCCGAWGCGVCGRGGVDGVLMAQVRL